KVGADEVLAVEGLDRIAVALAGDRAGPRRPARLRELGACVQRSREGECHGCCDRDGGDEQELRDGRANDAAPCAANWDVGVGSHATTVERGPNRPVTARQRFANALGMSPSLATR